jgi:hypothetical protein
MIISVLFLFLLSQIAFSLYGIKKMPKYRALTSFSFVVQNKTKQNKQANAHTANTRDDKTSRKKVKQIHTHTSTHRLLSR